MHPLRQSEHEWRAQSRHRRMWSDDQGNPINVINMIIGMLMSEIERESFIAQHFADCKEKRRY